jgi:hypothetical protein
VKLTLKINMTRRMAATMQKRPRENRKKRPTFRTGLAVMFFKIYAEVSLVDLGNNIRRDERTGSGISMMHRSVAKFKLRMV